MKQRKPTSTTATPNPSIFQQNRQKRERSTETRCTYTGFLPKPTKFDPDDPALVDRFPDYTPAIDIDLPVQRSCLQYKSQCLEKVCERS
jgi:hypothetical protein